MKTFNTPFGAEEITRKFIFNATQHSLTQHEANNFMYGNEPSEEARIKKAIGDIFPILLWGHQTGESTFNHKAAFEELCDLIDKAPSIIKLERLAANMNGQPF